MAYQLAFDIYESATQQLIGRIVQSLSASAPIPSLAKGKVMEPTAGVEGMLGNPGTDGQSQERDTSSLVSISAINIFKLKKSVFLFVTILY